MNFLTSSAEKFIIIAAILLQITAQYVYCKNKQIFSLGLSSRKFAADLFVQLDEGNQLISPILIQSGLSSLPTIGLTKNQIVDTLYVPEDNDERSNLFQNYIISLRRSKNIEVHSPSAMYVKNNRRVTLRFKKLFLKYGIQLLSADFSKSNETAHKINEWAKINTNEKITNIIDPSSITPHTDIVLICALYFRGNWRLPFLEEATFKRKFYSNGKDEKEINMMNQFGDFNYGENEELDAKFLEMDYENEDYKMTIVLPNKRDGVSILEKNLNQVFKKQIMTKKKISLTLPKFKFESKVELNEILKKLGLTSLFEDGISFNHYSKKLKVNNIVQKVFIDVNEVGTEAAGVMEVEMSSRFGMSGIKMFLADHPFLFFISQQSSGIILFVGRFTKPNYSTA